MLQAELLYIPGFQTTAQVKKKIHVPSQTREDHVDVKSGFKLP